MATAFADVIVIHKTNKNGKKMKSLKMASISVDTTEKIAYVRSISPIFSLSASRL